MARGSVAAVAVMAAVASSRRTELGTVGGPFIIVRRYS
jgi:hypothetical protein